MHFLSLRALTAVLIFCLTGLSSAQATRPALFVRYASNQSNEQGTRKTADLMKQAAAAGYNGIILIDNAFGRWDSLSPQHLANIKQTRDLARDLKLTYMPGCLPVGYANDLLTNDLNLAEAIPVVDAPFVVKDGKIQPIDDLKLINGDFEQHKNNVPTGWQVDAAGQHCFIDTDVKYEGKPSLRMQDLKNAPGGRARAWQTLKVQPWRYYHFSVAIKTDTYTGKDVRLMALGLRDQGAGHAGHRLNIPYAYNQQTQDWKRLHYTFNTQDCREISIYVGDWAGGTGKLWFADVTLEPVGLVNMVRRPGAPFKATTADGKMVLEEGKDLPPVADPLLGKTPAKGRYHWHNQPQLALPAGSRLKEGDTILLSYAHTMNMCYGDQVVICMAEPKANDLFRWQIQKLRDNLKPDGYFMMHDEIRIGGWDKSCTDTGQTPGQILAAHTKLVTDMIQQEDPGKRIWVWSDMFDKFHNAGYEDKYFEIVKGKNPWAGSWDGLPKEVGLVNWNGGKLDSLKWFSGRGNPQVISGENAANLTKWLDRAGDLSGIEGICYVTWSQDYARLEECAKAAKAWYARQTTPKQP